MDPAKLPEGPVSGSEATAPFKCLPSSLLKISLLVCFPLQRELGIVCLLLIVYGYLALANVLLLAPQEDFIS